MQPVATMSVTEHFQDKLSLSLLSRRIVVLCPARILRQVATPLLRTIAVRLGKLRAVRSIQHATVTVLTCANISSFRLSSS